ncbi:MAG: hypothetical protein FWD61_14235 [Phycisphaerales bacterium]|nr:hypothetical protein [Phycisphaerales bacterium]
MHESETSASLSPDQQTTIYPPGTQVRVTQQIPRRTDTYTTTATGTVLQQERQISGSWFAHNKLNRVWLDRLILKKSDGEITILNLDAYTAVEVLKGGEEPGESPLMEPAQDRTANLT